MPKKKIAQIGRKQDGIKPNGKIAEKPQKRRPATVQPLTIETKITATPEHGRPVEDLTQFPSGFENKAGRYELIRVDGGQAYYSFTNHQEKTVDATMPVVTWKKMQERAVAAYKEIA